MHPPDTAATFVPAQRSLPALARAAAACRGCPLYRDATQTVFGAGPVRAPLMLVGEQPGDHEDRAGRPFVGPAGRMLERALGEAGIPRERAYVTNAVKHFKWTLRGTRRIHKKPHEREIAACLPWLQAELETVRPQLVVAMGTTAARALCGRGVTLREARGRIVATALARAALITVHPSSLLRATGAAERAYGYAQFVADLRVAAARL
jgi:uracil-DNA glycosylase